MLLILTGIIPPTVTAKVSDSDLAPDVENPIFSQMATNLIGFQPLKIRFFGFFEDGARSESDIAL